MSERWRITCWSDGDVIDPRALFLRREAEEARRAFLVRVLVRHFDASRLRARVAFLPGLGAHHAAAVCRDVDASLEVIPFVRPPLEWHAT